MSNEINDSYINDDDDYSNNIDDLDDFHVLKNGYIISEDIWNKLYK